MPAAASSLIRLAPRSSYVPTGGSAMARVSASPIRRFEVVDGSSHAMPSSSIGSACDRTVLDSSSDATPSTTARRWSPSRNTIVPEPRWKAVRRWLGSGPEKTRPPRDRPGSDIPVQCPRDGTQPLRIGEAQEEVRDLPRWHVRVGGDLQLGTIQVDPAVALGRLRAHGHLLAEQSVESADRVAEAGNPDRRMVKPELHGSDRAMQYCLPAYCFGPDPRARVPARVVRSDSYA